MAGFCYLLRADGTGTEHRGGGGVLIVGWGRPQHPGRARVRSLTAAGDLIRVLTFCISVAGGFLRASIHTFSSRGKAEKGVVRWRLCGRWSSRDLTVRTSRPSSTWLPRTAIPPG